MKTMKNILFFFLFLLIYSCDKNQVDRKDNTTIYNIDSTICVDSLIYDEYSDRYSDRYCKMFYSSGELKASYTCEGDTLLHGTYKTFYRNGNLKDSTFYAGGFIYGTYQSFFSNGQNEKVIDYVVIDDGNVQSYPNRYILYDSLSGRVNDEESFYYTYRTIEKENSLLINISFDLPMYKDTAYIVIGNYDEFFRLPLKKGIRYIPFINNEVEFLIEKSKFNETKIRGIIYNYNFNEPKKVRRFYFYENVG
ncbi:MAG: hypothetical protein P1U44_09725 [Vicingaceae bacterium]|nr:hypothetical protein [Vicingaceae bacterium]